MEQWVHYRVHKGPPLVLILSTIWHIHISVHLSVFIASLHLTSASKLV